MKKTIALFEKNCHATEKSEAIACANRCQTVWRTRKESLEKWRARGGRGEALGVDEPKHCTWVP
jgi:hypothetical protein